MPDLLFTYYIKKPLRDTICKQWELEGVIVISLDIEIWVIGKCDAKMGEVKKVMG
jgi:hypothetical protein